MLEIPEHKELAGILAGETQLFSLTLVSGTPDAVEVQMHYGPESFMQAGLLIAMGESLELSTHT